MLKTKRRQVVEDAVLVLLSPDDVRLNDLLNQWDGCLFFRIRWILIQVRFQLETEKKTVFNAIVNSLNSSCLNLATVNVSVKQFEFLMHVTSVTIFCHFHFYSATKQWTSLYVRLTLYAHYVVPTLETSSGVEMAKANDSKMMIRPTLENHKIIT